VEGRALTLKSAAKVVVLMSVLLLTVGHPASANNDCQVTSSLCPEGINQRYWWSSSVPSAWQSSLNAARTGDIEPSVINTTLVSSHANSDIHVEGANLGDAGAWAATGCQDPSGSVCLHWHMFINLNASVESPGGPNYSAAHRNHISCHELGHTAGLEHHPNNNPSDPSCLYNVHSLHHPNLNTHDRNHIADILT
jgi:hypothetical protein